MNKKNLHLKIVHDEQRGRLKSKGQSLVEFAIAFPVIIILFSGLIEFGFMLNYYLSLLDATRESARYWANYDPMEKGYQSGDCHCVTCGDDAVDIADSDCDVEAFYKGAVDMVVNNLEPKLDNPTPDNSRKVILDPATDDVLVSVFNVKGAGDIERYPLAGPYSLNNLGLTGLTIADIESQLVSGAPNKLVLVVQVYYKYHPILALPWYTVLPDQLHPYSMMPMPAIKAGTH